MGNSLVRAHELEDDAEPAPLLTGGAMEPDLNVPGIAGGNDGGARGRRRCPARSWSGGGDRAAQKMGTSVGAVRSHLARGRDRLRTAVRGSDDRLPFALRQSAASGPDQRIG
jgi:hypothetical protein